MPNGDRVMHEVVAYATPVLTVQIDCAETRV